MHRTHRRISYVLGALAELAVGLTTVCATADDRPNIVYIMADDLGIGDTGVTGQLERAAAGLPAIRTPNIDTLAMEGMRFNHMHTGAPICSPSRAVLLTGFDQAHVIKERHNAHNGLRAGDLDRTWGQVLGDSGYKTSMFGKWHLGGVGSPGGELGVHDPDAIPTQKGFEVVYGSMRGGYRLANLWENDGSGGLQLSPVPPDPTWPGPGLPFRYSQDMVTDRAEQFIRDNANRTQPFVSYVAFQAPHVPLDQIPTDPYDNEPWPEVQKQYASMITRLDNHVGQLLAALDDPNGDGDNGDSVADTTLVIFTSDNGPLWTPYQNGFDTEFFDSNSDYDGEKTNTNEGGILAPFFARWTGTIAPGSVNDSHVGSFADIMPTFAEMAGAEAPFGIDGKSMRAALMEGASTGHRGPFIWSSYSDFRGLNQQGWAIRLADWKLIRRNLTDTYELYNLAADPSETTNLEASRGDIKVALETLAHLEGLLGEPFQTGSPGGTSVYFTQYKSWAPIGGSTDFTAAANWAGGTQFNRADDEENNYEALNWNTGPAANWLATVENVGGGDELAVVSTNARVLALEVRADSGTMTVNVPAGVELAAYNGILIRSGGNLQLEGGALNTIREIDIRQDGTLEGAGSITGQQHLITGIPEFENLGLLEPQVLNAGFVNVEGNGSAAAVLTIEGNYVQTDSGVLNLDLFGDGGVPGVDVDQLAVSGTVVLDGDLFVTVAEGFEPAPGNTFELITAELITNEGLRLGGPDGDNFLYSIVGGASLVLRFFSADFNSDGDVDGDDFLAWQSGFGLTSGASLSDGDADGDGDVDGDDFLAWQQNLNGAGSGQGTWGVPEPSSSSLFLLAALAFLIRRHA